MVDAGLEELIDASYVLADEGDDCRVYLVSTPGHTPGHCSVAIESNGQRALISGDCIHHPLQIQVTSRTTNFDSDSVLGASTRATLLGALAGTQTVLFGTHFAPPSCGHVRRDLSDGPGEFILDVGGTKSPSLVVSWGRL